MPQAAGSTVRALLHRWRWPLCYLALVQVLNGVFDPFVALETAADQLRLDGWHSANDMRIEHTATGTRWSAGETPQAIATVAFTPEPSATFVEVRACLVDRAPAGAGLLMFASVRDGSIDFNRQFAAYSLYQTDPGACTSERLPRLPGDGMGLLQVQLTDTGESLELSQLELRSLAEKPGWKPLRVVLLVLGVALVAWVFSRLYRDMAPTSVFDRLRAWLFLAVVCAIVFGCIVSIGLKAQIYALLTGGREVATAQQLALFTTVFPVGGFSVFTFGHWVLFAAAGFLVLSLRAAGIYDLMLLAAATETLQILVPGRGPGLSDVLVDWFGLALALVLFFVFQRARRINLFAKQ